MQAHDLDAPKNLDTVRKSHGRSRLFLEDDPPIEDDPPTSVEYDESMPSVSGHLVLPLPFSCFCFWF